MLFSFVEMSTLFDVSIEKIPPGRILAAEYTLIMEWALVRLS